MQARQSKPLHRLIDMERLKERERGGVCVFVCVFFLNFVSLFFYSGNSSTYFKVLCRSLQRKSDRTRSLAVLVLEYNLGPKPKITGSEVQY